ncbi:MAG: peptidoglycan-binding protein [Cyanobacteria bacterium P01_F01_bin.53]
MPVTTLSTTTLKAGDTGADVKELQQLLNEHNHPSLELTVDGIFGPTTKHAVTRFQFTYFLTQDGVVSPKTRNVLLKGGVAHLPILRRGANGRLVKRVQQVLSLGSKIRPLNVVQQAAGTRGFYFGPIDGDFGPMTENAVKAFQRLPVTHHQEPLSSIDGIIGPETWRALTILTDIILHAGR